jgi:hypothetical protein
MSAGSTDAVSSTGGPPPASDLAERPATTGGAGERSSPSAFDRAIALAAGALTFVIATAALIGWALGMARLTTLWPGGVPMPLSTVLGLKAGAVSLLLAFGPARVRYVQVALALAVAAAGLLLLMERVVGWDFGVNSALLPRGKLPDELVRASQPMIASINLAAIGLALTLVAARHGALQCLRAILIWSRRSTRRSTRSCPAFPSTVPSRS